MNHKRTGDEMVLAVQPSTKGFGYVVFEGRRSLIDWGVKSVQRSQKNRESLEKVGELLAFYRPDVIVLENYRGDASRREKRVRTLINLLSDLATKEGIRTASFSRGEVRACFVLTSKRQIALAIAREFKELEPRLPPVRRLWMSEDPRMSIFDASSLAITYFVSKTPAAGRTV